MYSGKKVFLNNANPNQFLTKRNFGKDQFKNKDKIFSTCDDSEYNMKSGNKKSVKRIMTLDIRKTKKQRGLLQEASGLNCFFSDSF